MFQIEFPDLFFFFCFFRQRRSLTIVTTTVTLDFALMWLLLLLPPLLLSLVPLASASGSAPVPGTLRPGRIHPTPGLDLPGLSGFLRPADAARICDAHPTCAGFTYRGLADSSSSSSRFPHTKYDMLFVRYVHEVDTRGIFSHWSSYVTAKRVATYDGTFAQGAIPVVGGGAAGSSGLGIVVVAKNVTSVCKAKVTRDFYLPDWLGHGASSSRTRRE